MGGQGNGLSQINKLNNKTISRVYKGIKSGIKEAGKAMSYYGKSTGSRYIRRSVPKDIVSSLAFGTTGSIVSRNNRFFKSGV